MRLTDSNLVLGETLLLKTTIVRSAGSMDRLRPEWDELMLSRHATMFQSFSWNRLAAERFADREAPFIVLAENDNGIAIIPAAIWSDGRIVLLGEALFDYRDTLSVGDPAVLAHAWSTIADLGLPLTVIALRGDASARQWAGFKPQAFCHAPGVALEDTSAQAMMANHRKLGRLTRRLERQGVRMCHHNGGESTLLQWIYRQKARQFHGSGNNIFADECRIEFMVAAAGMDAAACEIFTYEKGTEVVAALVTFRDCGTRRFYTIYFEERWAKESPGQVLVYNATLESLAQGLDCDYMTGEQPHKTRLATLLVPLYHVQLSAEELRQATEYEPASQLAA